MRSFRADLDRAKHGAGDARKKAKDKKSEITLRTLSYDEERGEYSLRDSKVRREDLPLDAVHVSGRKGFYFLDTVKDGVPPGQGMSAVDLNNWMINNSISEALASKGVREMPDLKKWLPILFGGAIALMAIWAWMGSL